MDPVVEKSLREGGLNKITGIDEVGRGSLAGPVVVASVMLPTNHKIDGINDSKKLSPKKREEISYLLFERAIDIQVSLAMNGVVDLLNIYNATKKCIKETLDNAKVRPDIVVIDGSFNHFKGEYELPFAYQTLPKGDALSENVAAASIIAKITRDKWMEINAHKAYPEYGFAQHKGYGTKQHMEALFKYGPCPLHRMTFSIKGKKIGDL